MQPGLIGQVLGNWELSRLLGEGAFGAVYLAKNTRFAGGLAAVKILHHQHASNPDLRRRFFNEASAEVVDTMKGGAALLAVGGAVVITGAVLVGLAARARRPATAMVVPVLLPGVAGLSFHQAF